MKRVFLIEHPKANIDVNQAASFGEIVYLFTARDRRPPIFNTEEYMKCIVQRLEELGYDPRIDYFCESGATLPLVLATAAIMDKYSEVKLLMFSAGSDQYVEKTLKSRKAVA